MENDCKRTLRKPGGLKSENTFLGHTTLHILKCIYTDLIVDQSSLLAWCLFIAQYVLYWY